MRRLGSARTAYSLVEMVAVMWALGVLLMLGMTILVGMFKIRQSASAAQDNLITLSTLADRFREDVAQAVTTAESIENWKASPTCLLLRRPGGGHVIYRWQEGRLDRVQLPGNQMQWFPVGPAGTEVEFLRPSAERRLVTLRLSASRVRGRRTPEISAALGGDLR